MGATWSTGWRKASARGPCGACALSEAERLGLGTPRREYRHQNRHQNRHHQYRAASPGLHSTCTPHSCLPLPLARSRGPPLTRHGDPAPWWTDARGVPGETSPDRNPQPRSQPRTLSLTPTLYLTPTATLIPAPILSEAYPLPGGARHGGRRRLQRRAERRSLDSGRAAPVAHRSAAAAAAAVAAAGVQPCGDRGGAGRRGGLLLLLGAPGADAG